MTITWVDKKSVLAAGFKSYAEGEIVPSGLLSAERIETFKKLGKISVQGQDETVEEVVVEKKRGRKVKEEEVVDIDAQGEIL